MELPLNMLKDFSAGVTKAFYSHAADLTGTWPPSLLIQDEEKARQAFPGSVVRLKDGSYHVVALKNGVVKSNDATCLHLTPIAGGRAPRYYSDDLAQSVQWISAGCLSSHTFQDDQVNLKQGLVASQGIHSRDDGSEEVRLRVEVGDGSGTIIRHTAAGAITEELSIEETLDKTSVSRVAWAAALPELDYSDIAVRRSKPVVTSFLVSVLSKAVYMQKHHADGSPQAVGEAFDALQDGHPSLAESRTAALDHYSSALETLGITREVQPSLSTGFIASLLAGMAERSDMADLATHCLSSSVENMGSALFLLVQFIQTIGEIDGSVIGNAQLVASTPLSSQEDAALLAAAVVRAIRPDIRDGGAGVQQQPNPLIEEGLLILNGMGAQPAQGLQRQPPQQPLQQPRPPVTVQQPHQQPQPPVTISRAIAMFTPANAPNPATGDAEAVKWMAELGGDEVQLLLARATGKALCVALTPLGKPPSVRRTTRDLTELVDSLELARAWVRDTSDPLWTAERPTDWEAAKERLSHVVDAGDAMTLARSRDDARLAAMPPPPPPPPNVSAGLFSSLADSLKGMKGRAPGETRLEKATTAQRTAGTVCSSEVLEPLQETPLLASELVLGSATTRAATTDSELRRLATLPGAGTPHAARAFVVSSATRLDGDAQGPIPVTMYQLRKAALAIMVAKCQEAVGRRRLSTAVRGKIAALCEALLAGTIDLEQAVELFGGIAPADNYSTAGFEEGNGTWGKMSVKADIKQALLFVFSLVRTIHAPLLDLDTAPTLDFGLEELFKAAQYMSVDRLVTTLKDAFDTLARDFETYRESLSAPEPCLRGALAKAKTTTLEPLAREQQTKRASTAAAKEYLESQKGAKGGDAELTALKRSLAEMERKIKSLSQLKDLDSAGTRATRLST